MTAHPVQDEYSIFHAATAGSAPIPISAVDQQAFNVRSCYKLFNAER
jgi:hypothetical protein